MDATPETTPRMLPPFEGAPDATELSRRILSKLTYAIGKKPHAARDRDWFMATALAVRDYVVDAWFRSRARAAGSGGKRVHYLSLEFLIGRLLSDMVGNLGLTETLREALALLGHEYDGLREAEPDAALGNGGLGRLAACFMESLATLGIPAYGYGIRYEHGLFRQEIAGGLQLEFPEDWLSAGNPWEFERPELAYLVGFGGHVAARMDATGVPHYTWHPNETVSAIAYDTPVLGGNGFCANTLRLWSARAAQKLQLDAFNRGDHVGATSERARLEAISRVLYPGDDSESGQELRLRQEFFFASASLQDILRRHLDEFPSLAGLPDKVAVQLNDTHPAIAIAELMRLLVDTHGVAWDAAWRITVAVFSYTNHTLLPEALESWPVPLMERLLPRHMQIIYLLNAQHLEQARLLPGADDGLLAGVSMIDETHGRRLRMGHLAFIGSHAINGVSAMHTELVRGTVFRELNAIYPDRIVNKTNGVTFRRWLHRANPRLTALLAETIGPAFLTDSMALSALAAHADDGPLQQAIAACRLENKQVLARIILERTGVAVDPRALLDVQVKRIHEYKRQLLNILQTVAQYNTIRAHPTHDPVPRIKLIAGKAAPGYRVAKQIIRLAHDVGHVINTDPSVRDRLKLVFLPNYNVSLAERIIPAADLSEQISTAGMEASGTGNMKLALNGALTIGTLDGANVEIRDRVGAAHMFIFGLTADQVVARKSDGLDAHAAVAASPALDQALQAIRSGVFSPDEPDRYRDFVDALLDRDVFMVAEDFPTYCVQQDAVEALWRDPPRWWHSAIRNIAGVGWFSSDRTIAEYAGCVWGMGT